MKSLRHIDKGALERITERSLRQLSELGQSAQDYYRPHNEPQANKIRQLLIPRHPLKLIQTRLNRRLFRRLAPHSSAYCAPGRGIVRAARQHAGHRWLFHADIRNFYPSVPVARVEEAFSRLGLPTELIELLTRLVTVYNQLPQGAPTSSAIGEMVLFPLDERLDGLVKSARLTYTRYADDITISGGAHLRDRLARKIYEIVDDCGWTLNDKGGVFGPDQRHEMLGLIINQHPNINREYARKLRWILALARKGEIRLTTDQLDSVAGKIAWIRQINPNRARKLEALFAAVTEGR